MEVCSVVKIFLSELWILGVRTVTWQLSSCADKLVLTAEKSIERNNNLRNNIAGHADLRLQRKFLNEIISDERNFIGIGTEAGTFILQWIEDDQI